MGRIKFDFDTVVMFGRYKHATIRDILNTNPEYMGWFIEQYEVSDDVYEYCEQNGLLREI